MKLVTYSHSGTDHQPRLGALVHGAVVDLEAAATWAQGACSVSREDIPDTLLELIYAGKEKWDYVRCIIAEVDKFGNALTIKGAKHRPIALSVLETHLHPPLHPLTLRDAYAFESHVKTAHENRGRTVPEEWYQFPVFYYTNPYTLFGNDEPVPCPKYTNALDYELEIAAVIGSEGINLGAEQAVDHIFGFTVFNDWSARDVQRSEMKVGLGPAKGKDFASSLGPCVITVDELEERATGRPGVYDLSMTARVNGKELSRGNYKDIHYSFGEIIARVSDSAPIFPGDIIGSGTVGTGCLLELTKGEGPWLKPGDVVELEVERIGILRNIIAR